jgi:hypothetical protein
MLGQQTDWQIKLLEALPNQPSVSLSRYGTQSFSEEYFTNFIQVTLDIQPVITNGVIPEQLLYGLL